MQRLCHCMAYFPYDIENIANIKQQLSSPLKRSILADNTNTSELLALPRKRTHFSASTEQPPPTVGHSTEAPDTSNKRPKPETPPLETTPSKPSFFSSFKNKFSIFSDWNPIKQRTTNTSHNSPRTLPPPDHTMHPLVDPLTIHDPGGTSQCVTGGPTIKPWAFSNLKREQDELSSVLSTSQRESVNRNAFSIRNAPSKTIFKNQVFNRGQRQKYEDLLASKSISTYMLSSSSKRVSVSSVQDSSLLEVSPPPLNRLSSSLLDPPPLPKLTSVSSSYSRGYKPENTLRSSYSGGHNTSSFVKPRNKAPPVPPNHKGAASLSLFSCPSTSLDISALDTSTRRPATPPPLFPSPTPPKHTEQDDICIVSVDKPQPQPPEWTDVSMETDPLLAYSYNSIKNIAHSFCLSRIKKMFEKEEIEAYNRKIAIQSHGKHFAAATTTTRKKNSSKERPSMHELNEKMKKLVNTMELDIGDSGMPGPGFNPVELGEEMESFVTNALIPSPQDEVLSSGFRLHIKRKDMSTLRPEQWLNDEIINFYCSLLAERSMQGADKQLPKVHTFNTFFYPQLKDRGYDSIKRWTRKIDIFTFDIITVPIHLGMHWCMAVIDFRNSAITYYDSFMGSNDRCLNNLLDYLKRERLDKKGETFDSAPWRLVHEKDIPEQRNSSDCGVFACQFAEFVTRDASLSFTQDDMPVIRRQMVAEILQKKLYH